jgi:molybdate transport system ATP-binding protein
MSGTHLRIKLATLAVNLSLPERGVSAIIGPSGAGKTTLLRAVAGLESTARGRVEINGEIWQDDTQKIFMATYQRPIGFVFQEPSLFSHLSVQGNIEFGLRRTSHSDRKIVLSHAIDLLGLAPLLKRFPATLSGGEKQRVSIARALATSPKLLLMDEPLASLDEHRKAEILPFLERLHHEFDIPLLYVSHALDEVARLANYVVVLEAGKVRATGSTTELLTRFDLPFAQGDRAFVLLTARLIARDEHYQLSQVEFAGGHLWVPQSQAILGAKVLLRIEAQEVSLSLTQQVDSSVLNSLRVKIISMVEYTAGLLIVELDMNGAKLLARITRKSADRLALHAGMALYAQIKEVLIKDC